MNYLFYLSHSVFDDILVLHNAKKRISVILLTFKNAVIDKKIWKNVREDVYSVVLASPKIFFQLTPIFWLSIMRERSNAFCQLLAYIAIDEAYLIWS